MAAYLLSLTVVLVWLLQEALPKEPQLRGCAAQPPHRKNDFLGEAISSRGLRVFVNRSSRDRRDN